MDLRTTWNKNSSEILSFFAGRMPQYVYGRRQFTDIPVLCFHSARYPDFERQLSFLDDRGFRTLDADEHLARLQDSNYKNDGKDIVLTFDDGLASLWTVAYPLLQRYQQKVVSFILPAMISGAAGRSKTIADDITPAERLSLLDRDFSDNPLCSWAEIGEMHDAGVVDFQSHGMHHRLVASGPRIVDFIHPEFDCHHYGNVHVPTYRTANGYSRAPVMGHPVYESAPLLSQTRRYDDPQALRDACEAHVRLQGGDEFFLGPTWRRALHQFVATERSTAGHVEPRYASLAPDVKYELASSKQIIEKRLNKAVRHFCFPWFAACEESSRVAAEVGYESMYLGASAGFRLTEPRLSPTVITRLQEEFILALPGYRGLTAAFRYKMQRKATW